MNYFTKDKPYNSLNEYLKKTYNKKVSKISLNINLTCPNKDGLKGYGGCTYCSKLGSGDTAGDINLSVTDQFNQIKNIIDKKWNDYLFIPYFQANSNTYGDFNYIKNKILEAINLYPDRTVGLSIATRADCLSDEIVKFLGEINKKIDVYVELGLQTSNEKTGIKINRCLTNQEFIDGVKKLRKYNISVICHIINGLPYETKDDMLNTIKFINDLDIQGVKIHSLLILKDTKIHEEYKNENFKILSLEEYIDIVTSQITILRPDIIIHRLSADSKVEDLVLPLWTRKKLVIMNEIDKYLRNNKLYQGIYYKK